MEKVGSKKKKMMMQRVASYPDLKQENISVSSNNRNKPACSNPKKFSGLHHRELASSKAGGMLSSSSSSRQSASRTHNSCNDDDNLSDMMIFKETASPIFSRQLTPKSSKLHLRKSKPKSRTNNRSEITASSTICDSMFFFSYPLCLSLQNSLLHNCNLIDTKATDGRSYSIRDTAVTKGVVRSEDATALLIEELDTTKEKSGKDYDTWTWNMYYSKSIPRSSLCRYFYH
jgi:hypothetical protein